LTPTPLRGSWFAVWRWIPRWMWVILVPSVLAAYLLSLPFASVALVETKGALPPYLFNSVIAFYGPAKWCKDHCDAYHAIYQWERERIRDWYSDEKLRWKGK
jgi:hypothetical protein